MLAGFKPGMYPDNILEHNAFVQTRGLCHRSNVIGFAAIANKCRAEIIRK
jgi:hypothetical protein